MLALRLCAGALRHTTPLATTAAIRTYSERITWDILKFPKVYVNSPPPLGSTRNVTRGEIRRAPFIDAIAKEFAGKEVNKKEVSAFIRGLLTNEPGTRDSRNALYGALIRDVEKKFPKEI